MKKFFSILAFIVLGLSLTQKALSQDNQHYVHCIMLDKTMSMTGSGGGKNIWPDVQEYCNDWVDGIKAPSTIVFFTYDKSLNGPQLFEIESDTDKNKVKEAVKNVKIDGRHTWIASNLAKAWNYILEKYPTSVKRIYLITDGIEEELQSSFSGVIKTYSASRGDYDYLYYVDLKGSAPEDVINTLDDTPGAGYGSGYHEFYTIKPSYNQLKYTIGKSQGLKQLFEVNDDGVANCSFTIKIDSVSVKGEGSMLPNVMISPSKVYFKDLQKNENSYEYDFNIVFHNNTMCPCDIFVKLEGEAGKDLSINFVPAEFCIQVRNKGKIVVTTKNGKGWRIR